MRKGRLDKLKKEFEELVDAYGIAVVKTFNQRHGDDEDINTPREKIVDFFKESPKEIRDSLLLIVYTSLTSTRCNMRLTNWLRNLAVSLISELRAI